MNERVNGFNGITLLGKQRAERSIVSVLGGEIVERLSKSYLSEDDKEDIRDDIQKYPLEFFRGKREELLSKSLKIIVRMYADPDYNDKQIDADCLELRQIQLAERAKQ